MKKTILTSIVILFFSMTGTALAAGKPPSKVCWKWDPFEETTVASIKKFGGTIKFSDDKTKFYAIHGQHSLEGVMVDGSGYMSGDIFKFAFSGSQYDEGLDCEWFLRVSGSWDVTADTGTMHYEWSGCATVDSELTLSERDCIDWVSPQTPAGENLDATSIGGN